MRYVFILALLLSISLQPRAQDYKIIGRISAEGNKHTKDHIISREMSFRSGDTIPADQLDEEILISQNNLINTLLFNYVKISKIPVDSIFVDIFVQVTERWYLWPIPVFEFADPNFNTWWLRKDFSRTNYGLVILKKNFRGRNEDIGAKAQFGYSKEFAFMYRLPYVNRKQNIGAGIWASYEQNNEITIQTEDNKRVFYTGTDGNARDELSIRLHATMRRKFYNYHTLETQYTRVRIEDTVTRMTSDYLVNNQTHSGFFSLHYILRSDHRDNKGYPLEGSMSQLDLNHHGLGIIDDFGLNVTSLTGTLNNYFRLSDNFYFASQLKGKYTFAKMLPYILQEGFGYTNLIRGYEYFIIDGKHFGMFKSNFKYRLFGPRMHEFEFLRGTGLAKYIYAFYLNLYVDAGYVYDQKYYRNNPLANQLLYGSGIGLDFVSFYDKVIRFEYSLNRELQHGFFLHFIKPI